VAVPHSTCGEPRAHNTKQVSLSVTSIHDNALALDAIACSLGGALMPTQCAIPDPSVCSFRHVRYVSVTPVTYRLCPYVSVTSVTCRLRSHVSVTSVTCRLRPHVSVT